MRARGAIRIVDGRIAEIGNLDLLPGEELIDASDCVVYPGLISTHHHLFQSVLKGVRAGIDSPLLSWLRVVPYSYWHKIDEEALRVAARIGLVELLLSGTTTAADHHYLFAQDYRFDPAHVIFEAAQELGIRLVFCRGGATRFRGFDTPDVIAMPTEPLDRMIRAVEDCARTYHDPSSDSTRRVACAVTTPPWAVAPDELRIIAASARAMGLRIHSHLSETRDYVDYCLATFGKRPVPWMADHDWLGPDVWFAHLVHVDDDEVDMLVETGTGVGDCPQSNRRPGRRGLACSRWRCIERGRRHDQRNEQRVAYAPRHQRSDGDQRRGRGALGERRRCARARVRGVGRAGGGETGGDCDLRALPSPLFWTARSAARPRCRGRCGPSAPPVGRRPQSRGRRKHSRDRSGAASP